jgi:hypothetical protein
MLRVMATMWPRWALPKLKLQLLRKLSRVELESAPRRKMPKRMRRLNELRCEGVEFNAFEHLFCKDILAHLRHHTFHAMERVFL